MQAGFHKYVVEVQLYRGGADAHGLGNGPVFITLDYQPQGL